MPYEEAYLLETFLAAVGTNDAVAVAETASTDVAAATLIVVAVVVVVVA